MTRSFSAARAARAARAALLLTLTLAASASASAQQPERAAGADSGAARPPQDFARLTRDAVRIPGFFDFYRRANALYLAIPRDRLGKEFLLTAQISQGIGAAGLFGGTMLNIFESSLVALERHGDRVYLVQRPHRYTGRDSATAAAVRLSFASSVLESAPVMTTREDSTVLINVHDWFVSDLSDVGQRVRAAVAPRPGTPGRATVDRNRSYLESVKSFPRNSTIRALLTFTPGEPVNLQTVPDSRYVPVGISYQLAALPEQPMTRRVGDDRMGFFLTVHKDFSSDSATFFARYVNKWRLECAGPATNGLCDPRTPITYYIDRTVPEDMRPFMIAGVTAWNKAYEKAGFRNAVRALPLPDGADADDIRYSTLRWNTSDIPGYGAIGPSMVDPRTGEILDADILFEANMVMGFRNAWRTLVNPVQMANHVMGDWSERDLQAAAQGFELSSFAESFASGGALLRSALVERGEIGADDPVPMAYVGEALKWVTMHEVGHTLGLRHNFRSSADTPIDSLASRAWAERVGLYSSVMEYPVPNIQPSGRQNGYFYNPTVGSSDEWVIAFGYTPDAARAAALAREGASAGHAYGTDEDAGGAGALDPTITPNDMSADPLAWAKQRTAMVSGLMRRLPQAVLVDNAARANLTSAFQSLLGQYAGAAGVAVKYVGGQLQYRDHVGDPNARAALVPIPVAKQREALRFLSASVFSADAFNFPPAVLQQFGSNRWSHWGLNNTINGRIDYPLLDQALGIQTAIMSNVLNPVRMRRIRDAELRFGATAVVPVPEIMGELAQSIWSEAWSGPSRNVPALRRDLQRAHLDALVDLVVKATPPTSAAAAAAAAPADARASARASLSDIDRRLAARLAARAGMDAITAAHFAESRALIAKALDAGLERQR